MTDDDPEARIRALEQGLANQASASELGATQPSSEYTPPPAVGGYVPPPVSGGYVPPPTLPPVTYGNQFGSQLGSPVRTASFAMGRWIVVAVVGFVFLGMAVAAGVAYFALHSTSSNGPTSFYGISGSSTSTASQPNTLDRPSQGPSSAASETGPAPAPGATLEVNGIDENKTLVCDDNNNVTVAGITNTVTISGHCAKLTVQGSQNVVTVDEADSIEASGIGNQVTYHSGSPQIDKSGINNVVQQG